MATRDYNEGMTERIVVQLKEEASDGTVSNLDATGFTFTDCVLESIDGQPVLTTSKAGFVSAAAGTVYFDPAVDDLKADKSPYRLHWVLTDGAGKKRAYPTGKPDEIRVFRTAT